MCPRFTSVTSHPKFLSVSTIIIIAVPTSLANVLFYLSILGLSLLLFPFCCFFFIVSFASLYALCSLKRSKASSSMRASPQYLGRTLPPPFSCFFSRKNFAKKLSILWVTGEAPTRWSSNIFWCSSETNVAEASNLSCLMAFLFRGWIPVDRNPLTRCSGNTDSSNRENRRAGKYFFVILPACVNVLYSLTFLFQTRFKAPKYSNIQWL